MEMRCWTTSYINTRNCNHFGSLQKQLLRCVTFNPITFLSSAKSQYLKVTMQPLDDVTVLETGSEDTSEKKTKQPCGIQCNPVEPSGTQWNQWHHHHC